MVLVAGIGQRAPVAEKKSFLPHDSDVARAMDEIDTLFGASDVAVVTLVFRGDVLTPATLAQMDGLLGRIVADPGVAHQLAPVDPIIAPTLVMAGLLHTRTTAAITIAYSLIVSVLVVPPAMTVWGSYQNMRLRSMVERLWNDLDVAIEDTHQRHEQGQG